jgi:hypothetical protein
LKLSHAAWNVCQSQQCQTQTAVREPLLVSKFKKILPAADLQKFSFIISLKLYFSNDYYHCIEIFQNFGNLWSKKVSDLVTICSCYVHYKIEKITAGRSR